MAKLGIRTWQELADELDVTTRSLQMWRNRPEFVGLIPELDEKGYHDAAAWRCFMIEHGLAGAEPEAADGFPDGSIQDWSKKLIKKKVEHEDLKLKQKRGELLETSSLEIALGQLLAGLSASFLQMPYSVAAQLAGIKDPHIIQRRLSDEVDAIFSRINACEFLTESKLRQLTNEQSENMDSSFEPFALVSAVLQKIGQQIITEATTAKAVQKELDQVELKR